MALRALSDDEEPEETGAEKSTASGPAVYKRSPELAKFAAGLIGDSPTNGLTGLHALKAAKIVYVTSSAESIGGCFDLVKAQRWPKTMTPFGRYDFKITVALGTWETLDEKTRKARMYHALLHCGVNDKEQWMVKEHDLEEFQLVVKQHGIVDDKTRAMAEQMTLALK